MRLAQRWTWALLATLVGLSVVFLVALKAEASTGQEVWVGFECVTNQDGETLPMYSVEGRPGAEFTVNDQAVGAVLNGGYGVNGENTWTATPLPGYELTSPTTGVVTLDCGGFETAGGCYERNKCGTTTTQPITTTTTSLSTTTSSSPFTTTTTTTPSESSTTVSETVASTTTSPVSTTTAPSESTTTTVLATSLTSQPPSSTDLTVAPADAGGQLPDTGLSHNMWAFLVFAAFVLLTMGGMAVLAGRDDDE